jgi:endogenous inhibitor of DNA gyrase (YacG/DUF329 family)
MYKCPHCGKPGITLIDKMFVGPMIPVLCKTCGKKVGVPYKKAMLTAIPFAIGAIVGKLIAGNLFNSPLLGYLVFIIGVVIGVVIHLHWIPLERR